MPNKQTLIDDLKDKHQAVLSQVGGDSPATLDYLLKQRQALLETVFDHYADQLEDQDIEFLESILASTIELEDKIDNERHQKGNELIQHKKSSNRMQLYTRIAQHK